VPEMRDYLPKIEDYPAYLEQAWQQHLAPRQPDAPTVISLFAGCGGSSLGYSMAGYRELLAVDWDKVAVETFRLNFPGVPIWQGDIHKLSGNEAMHLAGVDPGELDVLDGSPPCQGFSTAGKRKFGDERNRLFEEYVRLLQTFRPKAFVMENVSGMVKGKMRLMFAEAMQELKSSKYDVSCRLLNAKWFGVPQSRERLIWIGIRNDLKLIPSHPKAKFREIDAAIAIMEVEIASCGQPRVLLADRMRKVKPGSNLARSEKTNAHFSYVRLPLCGASMTLQKSISFGGITIWHPTEERNLSIAELKRISSFSDDYLMPEDYRDAVAMMGNSVPPLFMRAIALHVRRLLANQIE